MPNQVDPSKPPGGGPPRNTSTNLHRHIVHNYVRRTTSGKACWFLKDTTRCIVRLKSIDVQVSVHRLLYALFVGPIQEGIAVSPKQGCGTKFCICPYHQVKEPASFLANPLDLDPYMEVLDAEYAPKERRKFEPLPSGVSARQVHLCKHLHRDGKSLAQLQSYTQLTTAQIYRVINGVYDNHIEQFENQAKPIAAQSSAATDELRRELLGGPIRKTLAMPSDTGRSDDQPMGVAKVDSQANDHFGPIDGKKGGPGDDDQGGGAPAMATPPVPRDPGPGPGGPGPVPPGRADDDDDPDELGSTDEDAWLASLRGN